jgi:hypothetical protein
MMQIYISSSCYVITLAIAITMTTIIPIILLPSILFALPSFSPLSVLKVPLTAAQLVEYQSFVREVLVRFPAGPTLKVLK